MKKTVDVYELTDDGYIIAQGTLKECAEQLNVTENAIRYYTYPTHLGRLASGKSLRRLTKVGTKEIPRVSVSDFAVYRGDDFITVGNLYEVAKELNIKPETLMVMATPTWIEKAGDSNDRLIAIRLEKEDEDD